LKKVVAVFLTETVFSHSDIIQNGGKNMCRCCHRLLTNWKPK